MYSPPHSLFHHTHPKLFVLFCFAHTVPSLLNEPLCPLQLASLHWAMSDGPVTALNIRRGMEDFQRSDVNATRLLSESLPDILTAVSAFADAHVNAQDVRSHFWRHARLALKLHQDTIDSLGPMLRQHASFDSVATTVAQKRQRRGLSQLQPPPSLPPPPPLPQ